MAKGCSRTQYWESLVQLCQPCHLTCKRHPSIGRCNKFCASTSTMGFCRNVHTVLKFVEVKTLHALDNVSPPFLSPNINHFNLTNTKQITNIQCFSTNDSYYVDPSIETTPAVAATGRVTTPVQTLPPAGPSARSLDSSILVYSLWALSVVLVFSSLSLAFRVFLREARSGSAKTGLKCSQGILNKDLGLPLEEVQFGCGPGDSSTPTENCVCVHCFPDPSSLASDNPIRESWSNQEVEQQRVQYGEAGWTHRAIYSSESNAANEGPV
ncbi:uncharacterized protein [Eucyclogobius newberryi]|uniref:uncharacterized protein n=1 Tax=Eucyclogobius newberryi TaxID=166745 RepID=UPI003B58C176